MWDFLCPEVLNLRSQWRHLKGLAPVWRRMWTLRLPLVENMENGGELRSPDEQRLEVHVHVDVVAAVRVAVAALAADERVVAVGLGLAAVALVALHT